MSSTNSVSKIEAAPEEPLEKGKREAEDVTEKDVARVKRQKVEDGKTEEPSNSELDISEQPIKVKVCVVDGHVVSVSRDESSGLEEDQKKLDDVAATKRGPEDSGTSSEHETNAAADVAHAIPSTKQSGVSTHESDDWTGSHVDVDTAMAEKTQPPPTKMGPVGATNFKREDESSFDECDLTANSISVPATNKKDQSIEESESDNKPSNDPKTAAAPDEHQTIGPKTLYVGNLSFSVEQEDVEDFFNAAGEIVGIRFGMNPDESFRGFGFVEFSSAEAAKKALHELNGKELLRRPVKLDLVRERGSHTPYIFKDTQSFHKGERAQGQKVFVRGFNKFDGEDKIRSSLKEHFGSCGEITGVSIPKDQDGAIKGIAFIDFKDSDAYNQALDLNGSKFGVSTLSVEEVRRKHNIHESGGSGRGWRTGDREFGGRSGGWNCTLSTEEARPRHDSRDSRDCGRGWRNGDWDLGRRSADRDFGRRSGGWDCTFSMEEARPRYCSRDSGGSRDWRSGGWDFGGSSRWDSNISAEEAKPRRHYNRDDSVGSDSGNGNGRGWSSSGWDFVGGSEGAGFGWKNSGWNCNLSAEGSGPRHYNRDGGSSGCGWRSGSQDFGSNGRGFGGRSDGRSFGGRIGGRGFGGRSDGWSFGGRSDGKGFSGRSGGQGFGGRSGGRW